MLKGRTFDCTIFPKLKLSGHERMETLRVSFLLSRFNDLSIYSEYSDCNFYVTLEADRFCYFV